LPKWSAISSRITGCRLVTLRPRLLVYEKGIDDQGKPIQIVLPSRDDYEDTPYLLAKAVNLLSVLESVSFQDIVKAINASAHV
jgi:hypothetical protein